MCVNLLCKMWELAAPRKQTVLSTGLGKWLQRPLGSPRAAGWPSASGPPSRLPVPPLPGPPPVEPVSRAERDDAGHLGPAAPTWAGRAHVPATHTWAAARASFSPGPLKTGGWGCPAPAQCPLLGGERAPPGGLEAARAFPTPGSWLVLEWSERGKVDLGRICLFCPLARDQLRSWGAAATSWSLLSQLLVFLSGSWGPRFYLA